MKQCPLFDICYTRTASCRESLPDKNCYWYRWFKQRIEKLERMEGDTQMSMKEMKEKQMELISLLIINVVMSEGTGAAVEAVINYSQEVMDLYKEEQ